VVVCDSDEVRAGAAEGRQAAAAALVNEGEARVAVALAACLLRAGVRAHDIAIISPFRAQLRRVRELLDEPPRAGAEDGRAGAEGGCADAGVLPALPAEATRELLDGLRAVDALTIDQSQGQDRVRARLCACACRACRVRAACRGKRLARRRAGPARARRPSFSLNCRPSPPSRKPCTSDRTPAAQPALPCPPARSSA
jgi:hypothetical protein